MPPPATPTLCGPRAPTLGVTPALALVNPRYPANVGMVVRLASCYGVTQVWFSGERVSLDPGKVERLPRLGGDH
jgi:tRNA(Leu) C34 or U34 (ribose-2'-O)-methylase TrmL